MTWDEEHQRFVHEPGKPDAAVDIKRLFARCSAAVAGRPASTPAAMMLSCHGIRQTLEGSFSAVSKPNFASKYAFESSRRDLHNALLCTAPKSHFFKK